MIRDLNRNLILGLDWLKNNNVRLYFDLKCLRINGKHYVNLEEKERHSYLNNKQL